MSHATQGRPRADPRVPPGKIVVIHEAVEAGVLATPSPAAIADVMRRYGLHSPYCLFVGNLEPRKNLPRLIQAFAQVRRRLGAAGRSTQLVLAGTRAWLHAGIFRAVEEHGLGAAVVFTDYVPLARSAGALRGRDVFRVPVAL